MAPLSLTIADVGDLGDGGGAGHGHLPVAAGDGFPCQPVSIEKFYLPVSDFSCLLFSPYLYLFLPDLYLFLHCNTATQDFLMTFS